MTVNTAMAEFPASLDLCRSSNPSPGDIAEGSMLRAELSARNAMIEEMDHRVKNHLQLIASYARNLARDPGETAAHIAGEIAVRLTMVAAIHDALHLRRGKDGVSAPIFLAQTCRSLADGEHQIQVVCDEDLLLDADEMAPVGMILVEAVCNCLKHGFLPGQSGAVTVSFRRRGEHRVLEVSDDGIGLSPAIAAGQGNGLRLINAFARRLRASLAVTDNVGRGTLLRLILPAREPAAVAG